MGLPQDSISVWLLVPTNFQGKFIFILKFILKKFFSFLENIVVISKKIKSKSIKKILLDLLSNLC